MLFFFLSVFIREFGDKSSPPSLPDTESGEEDTNGEKCDISDNEKEEAECVKSEEQQTSGENATDEACCGLEELKLAEPEEDKVEISDEKEDQNQDDQKTLQGSRFSSSCFHIVEQVLHVE